MSNGTFCPASLPNACTMIDSRLPTTFCCQADTYCVSLDNASTALCCPGGQNCGTIEPISCDLRKQDPTLQTQSEVWTVKLSTAPPQCGKETCCPFGYFCSNNLCAIDTSISFSAPGFNTTTIPPSSIPPSQSTTSVSSSPYRPSPTTVRSTVASTSPTSPARSSHAPTNGGTSDRTSHSLAWSAKAGIAVACLVFATVIVGAGYLYVRSRQKRAILRKQRQLNGWVDNAVGGLYEKAELPGNSGPLPELDGKQVSINHSKKDDAVSTLGELAADTKTTSKTSRTSEMSVSSPLTADASQAWRSGWKITRSVEKNFRSSRTTL